MIDFYDLARSGTAPEASKSKSNQVASSAFGARPKTRSVENDVLDFNIDLRTNKPSYLSNTHDNSGDYFGSSSFDNEDLLQQAIESFQADLEDWTGRKDYDAAAANRQQTSSNTRRGSKDARKVHSAAVSAYTQNVPQIVLQTSRKGTKPQASSPRPAKDPKPDLRADIRAVYGADFLDKSAPTSRPKSQKPRSQTSGTGSSTNANKMSDEAIPVSSRKDGATESPGEDTGGYVEQTEYTETSREGLRSAGGATRSTSASRLRANVSSHQAHHTAATGPTAAGGAVAPKPFSVRKAAPGSATGPRQGQVPRPFSHNEVPKSSVIPTAVSRQQGALDTPTSSSSSKRVGKKAPVGSANALLKSSLTHSKTRSADVEQELEDFESDNTGDSLRVPEGSDLRHRRAAQQDGDYGASAGAAHGGAEGHMKERASTAGPKIESTRRTNGDTSGGSGNAYSYTQSAGTAGMGLSGTGRNEASRGDVNAVSNAGSKHGVQHSSSRDSPSTRAYSRSPTLNMEGLSLARPDSDAALVDFIQDSDIMEESFEESPILAAYLQQKSHASHHNHKAHQTNYESNEGHTDSAGRPQSRKLYLGAEKEGTNADGTPSKASYKTAPRSAGARYTMPDSPLMVAPPSDKGSPVALRKMSSFSELMPNNRKWNENTSQLPDLRPPSRQSSAFPVHLADDPPATAAAPVARHAEAVSTVVMSKSTKATSPTSKGTPVLRPNKQTSMQWERDDDAEEPYEEDIPVMRDSTHLDCEVESYPASEIDTPRGRVPSSGAGASALLSKVGGSAGNSVQTSLSVASAQSIVTQLNSPVTAPTGAPASSTPTTAPTASTTVVPAKEHIGIVRAPATPAASADVADIPTYELQRPPSRQKFAAPQHLFEGGMPPPTRVGTEKETARSTKTGGQGSSPEQIVEPSSRSNTARATTLKYNPRDDGFADLAVGSEPFVIKLNTDEDTPEKSSYMDEFVSLHSPNNRAHRRSYNALSTAGSGAPVQASRSSSSDADALMGGGLGIRPQTVASVSGKPGRLLGVYQPHNSGGYTQAPSPVTTARGKTAGDSLRPPAGAQVRREGNNFLLSQPPFAPAQPQPTAPSSHSRNSSYGSREPKLSEFTMGPPGGRGAQNSGWMDADTARNPRTQSSKGGDGGYSGYDNAYSMAPSSSSHALPLALRPTSRSPGQFSSEEPDSEDDMTILTEDSDKHNMEAGMSMHSLVLDSSLGEDFLSLFAPGPP